MKHLLIKLAAVTLFALWAIQASPALAAPYPDKPVRLIVPTTAGSLPDQLARWLAERLAGELGQAVVVDNRPGAGGTIGLAAVARAAPDGYTLGLQALPYIVGASLLAKMPYDTERDLAPVTLVNWTFLILAVPANSPIRSVPELVELARERPGKLTFSSQGNGSPSHLALSLFAHQTGLKLTHIPFKGGAASLIALLAGEVDMSVVPVGPAAPHLKSGKLRALATNAPRRIAVMPDLPTLAELGYADVQFSDWQGIVAPAGTPRSVIDRLHAEIARILARPDSRAGLAAMGMEPAGLGPEEFTSYQHAEMQKWARLVRAAGITAE